MRLCSPLSIAIILCSTLTLAQEKSVKPGINDSFKNPDVSSFVERFEREGREVYDHREKIIASANFQKGSFVADVGAGTGLFTQLIAKELGQNGSVIAVDIAKEFVDHIVTSCREDGLSNVSGQVCKPDSVELPSESIDTAYICDTYHHFEFPYKTMRSIYRALKPGGRVVLVEFHREEGKSSDWILGHLRAGQDVFVNEIKLAGFDVAKESDFMETSYFMIFEKSNHQTERGHSTDSLTDLKKLINDKTAVLLDVREQSEWDAGHLQTAQLFPLSDLTDRDQKGRTGDLGLPRDQIIYTHCKSGFRSVEAAKILQRLGYDARARREGFADLVKSGFERSE